MNMPFQQIVTSTISFYHKYPPVANTNKVSKTTPISSNANQCFKLCPLRINLLKSRSFMYYALRFISQVIFCNFHRIGSCGIFWPFPWLVYIQFENVLNFDPSLHHCLKCCEKKSEKQNKELAYSEVQKWNIFQIILNWKNIIQSHGHWSSLHDRLFSPKGAILVTSWIFYLSQVADNTLLSTMETQCAHITRNISHSMRHFKKKSYYGTKRTVIPITALSAPLFQKQFTME